MNSRAQVLLNEARLAIHRAFPALRAAEITQVAEPSASYVVNVRIDASDTIFRFPLGNEPKQRFSAELKVLKTLAGRLPCAIPQVEYLSQNPQILGYRRIPGQALTATLIRKMAPAKRTALFNEMAQFLASLHSQDVAAFNFLPRNPSKAIPRRIRDQLDKFSRLDPSGDCRGFAEQALADFDKAEYPKNNNVLLHHDFQPKNILADAETGRMTGVIDFNDLWTGDPHWDFRHLPNLGGDALTTAIAKYGELTQRAIDKDIVEILYRLQLCRSLRMTGTGSEEAAHYVNLIKRYHKPE